MLYTVCYPFYSIKYKMIYTAKRHELEDELFLSGDITPIEKCLRCKWGLLQLLGRCPGRYEYEAKTKTRRY